MKTLLLALLVFSALHSSAQNISGIYSGTIKNDSLKMTQNYELALSEYKGKITGYSYITFVKNDTFYYGIKRIKASREDGQLVVEDVDMLMNNYPQRPDKGVHLINYFPLIGDSIVDLNGTWKTTQSKKHGFYSIGGDLSLRKDDDSTKSTLICHLKELNIIKYQEEKAIAKTDVKQKKKEDALTPNATRELSSSRETKTTGSPEHEIKSTAQNKLPSTQKESFATVKAKPNNTASKTEPETSSSRENLSRQNIAKQTTNDVKPDQTNRDVMQTTAKPEGQSPTKTPITPEATVSSSKEEKSKLQAAAPEVSLAEIKSKEQQQTLPQSTIAKAELKQEIAITPSVLEKRASNTIQVINVLSDSLTLSFYDNGVVDGDSISVYVNTENIISKTKLTAAAAKKTIYVGENTEELKVTLVAESLGSIPPNTGLLIIQDGDQRYNIRFSADMETNASVIIRKKKS